MSMDPFRPPDDPDFDNPYAAPKAVYEPQRAPAPGRTVAIRCAIDAIVAASWSIFQRSPGACLWAVWAVILIATGLRMMLTLVMSGLEVAMPGERATIAAINFAAIMGVGIVQVWLGIGMNLGLLRIARGQPISFDVLFSGGRYLVRSILGWIIASVLLIAVLLVPWFLVFALAMAFRDQGAIAFPVMIAGGVGCLVLMFYLAARFSQFSFLVLDRDAGAIEAIQSSWELTRGHAGTIVLVYISQLVFLLAGLLAFCVGLIVAIPFSNVLLTVTYLAVTGAEKSGRGAAQLPERIAFTNWDEDL